MSSHTETMLEIYKKRERRAVEQLLPQRELELLVREYLGAENSPSMTPSKRKFYINRMEELADKCQHVRLMIEGLPPVEIPQEAAREESKVH